MVPLVTVLASALDTGSAQYAGRRAAMLAKLDELAAEHAKALAGGGPKYVKRHRDRGKLTVRERVELLIDPDSPFLELSALAGYGTGFPVGGSGVNGIGVISGTECLISGSDPTVRGGSTNPWSLRKSLRSMQIAIENRLPLVNLVESGGARQLHGRRRVPAWDERLRRHDRRAVEGVPGRAAAAQDGDRRGGR